MSFSIIDILLGLLTTLIAGLGGIVSAYYGNKLLGLPSEWVALTKLILFFGGGFFTLCLMPRLLRMIFPIKEGIFKIDNGKNMTIWKLQQFLYDCTMSIVGYSLPVGRRNTFYWLLGSKISKGVMIGGKLIEPPLIEIGENSFVGENALLIAHAIEGNLVVLKKIKIGKNVTIGALSVIMPGVEVGDKAIVAAGSVVTKNSKILPGEVWGGVPARKIVPKEDRKIEEKRELARCLNY